MHGWTPATVSSVPSDVVEMFEYYDANRSGFLDYLELQGALQAYGFDVTVDDCINLTRQYDVDQDGKLNLVRERTRAPSDSRQSAHHAPHRSLSMLTSLCVSITPC